MAKLSGIYRIVNIKTNKLYIGSAVNIKKRFNNHKDMLYKNKHHCKHLQNSWNKYGDESFLFEIVELCDPDVLISLEQKYIDSYKPENLYNICMVAGNSLGVKRRPETVEANRKANTGRKMSEETKQRMILSKTGTKPSEETKKKISDSNKGLKRTDETRKNMSLARKGKSIGVGRKVSDEARLHMSIAQKARQARESTRTPTGIKRTEAAKEKMRKANLGRKHSEETKRKMSETRKGRVLSDETKEKIRISNRATYEKKSGKR